jgi:hypothetical protein
VSARECPSRPAASGTYVAHPVGGRRILAPACLLALSVTVWRSVRGRHYAPAEAGAWCLSLLFCSGLKKTPKLVPKLNRLCGLTSTVPVEVRRWWPGFCGGSTPLKKGGLAAAVGDQEAVPDGHQMGLGDREQGR